MTNPTTQTATDRRQAFVQTITEQISHLAQSLGEWVQSQERSLQEIEVQLVRLLHDLGTSLLSGLLPLAAPAQPVPDLPCVCGQTARFVRMRSITLTTLLGRVPITRAYYHCASCAVGFAPLDTQLQICAGSLSAGLTELLALLGATQDSFVQAAEVLARLSLVQICANSVRAATEELGALLCEHDQHVVAQAQETHTPPQAARAAPKRVYIGMDGVLAHTHQGGWKELKTGCVYTTRLRASGKPDKEPQLRAEQHSYIAALTDSESFGWQLWAEACRRGVGPQSEVVVVADGAHWIWNVADEHFPGATQIVDWYHASSYVWQAASAIYAEQTEQRANWAKEQESALWQGQVAKVLVALQPYAGKKEVEDALSYYITHQGRMDYPAYRERGLQIGSGTIESTCKQLVSARLKLAGMIWDEEGAEAVAVVRAWLKSGRWDEAIELRPPPRRSYNRQAAAPQASAIAA